MKEEVGLPERSNCVPSPGRCEVITVTSATSLVL